MQPSEKNLRDGSIPDPWALTDPGGPISRNEDSDRQEELEGTSEVSGPGPSHDLSEQVTLRLSDSNLDVLLGNDLFVEDSAEEPQGDPFRTEPEQLASASLIVDPEIVRRPDDQQRIGPYRLLEKLGEGGMGAVWLAQQEHPIKRQVAIKMIRAGKDSRQIVARFDAERQALAMMNHRHIAKVYEAGVSDRWGPYFVMEFCRGRTITAFVERKRLSLTDRLKVFLQVCRAVEHAHQEGIIHRDLKPNNILVSVNKHRVEAKVIDFGLAKATVPENRLTDKTLTTHAGQPMGTYKYMSPEQTRSDPRLVDTRSDLYSLGAILYELLTGLPPLDACNPTDCEYDELLRSIREKDPPLPSKALSESVIKHSLPQPGALRSDGLLRANEKKLRRELAAELDWIVMKSIHKNPALRYQTATELIQDIQNFQQGVPVAARPPSRSYQLQRFWQRNRVAMVLAGIAASYLVLSTVVSIWLLIENSQLKKSIQDRVNVGRSDTE